MKKFFICAITLLLFTGCATIISGTRQMVVFAAPEGTRIFNDGIKLAEIPRGEEAVSVLMNRSLNGLFLIAKKDGYKDTRFFVKTSVNGVVFINILLGGVIGGAVDLATGAAAKYPNYIEIEMEPLP